MYILRELRRSDIPTINTWRADRELISRLGAPYRFINQEVDERWFNSYMDHRSNTVRCAIVEADAPDAILGLVSLCEIDNLNRSCQLHIMIGDKNQRGKGMGYFAFREIMCHAFEDLNLNRIEVYVLTDNEASLRLCRKAGFVDEGVLRQYAFKDGRYKDTVIMGALREDWRRNAD